MLYPVQGVQYSSVKAERMAGENKDKTLSPRPLPLFQSSFFYANLIWCATPELTDWISPPISSLVLVFLQLTEQRLFMLQNDI